MTATLRPFDARVVRDRSIRLRWLAGERTVKHDDRDATETIVEVKAYHDQERRQYYARLSPLESDGEMERWSSGDPGITLLREPVARYSATALSAFADRAVARVIETVEHPGVAELLARVHAVQPAPGE
jgi:hypothetical protein